MQIGIFTNGVYTILGISINNRVIGIITKTYFKYIYRKYKFVNLPLYHLKTDTKPQFYKI
jgi:hypothetical protein